MLDHLIDPDDEEIEIDPIEASRYEDWLDDDYEGFREEDEQEYMSINW